MSLVVPKLEKVVHKIVLGAWGSEPTVLQDVLGQNSSLGVATQHRDHEVVEKLGLFFSKSVLSYHHIFERPIL